MSTSSRAKFRNVLDHLARARPDLADPEGALVAGHVLIDGRVVTNPRSQVRADASVVIKPPRALRGEDKLRAALEGFAVDVTDRECVDLGASAGGFTRVLLEHGARRVFAVDAGHGQLRGDLRNHSRVVNLERTNLGDLSAIPRSAPIGAVTMDLSYLSVADAVPQIETLSFAPDADLIALVKPMFELGLDAPPEDDPSLRRALDLAVAGVERAPWHVAGTMPSPVTGVEGRARMAPARRQGDGVAWSLMQQRCEVHPAPERRIDAAPDPVRQQLGSTEQAVRDHDVLRGQSLGERHRGVRSIRPGEARHPARLGPQIRRVPAGRRRAADRRRHVRGGVLVVRGVLPDQHIERIGIGEDVPAAYELDLRVEPEPVASVPTSPPAPNPPLRDQAGTWRTLGRRSSHTRPDPASARRPPSDRGAWRRGPERRRRDREG